ncbi:MAG: putative sensor domain DACNV-containing protein [bacterium]
MDLPLIAPDSPFVVAVVKGVELRRTLVAEGHVERARSDALTGDSSQLAQLVNICFWASLAAEEGRPVRGAISICSPQQVPSSLAFSQPEAVSTESLVSLLTATRATALGVHGGPEGMEVWGLVEHAPFHSLRLRIGGTGIVVASRDKDVLAVLHGGRISIPKSATELTWMQIVAGAFGSDRPFPERLKLAALLLRVVARMHRHGHGGILVIIPSAEQSWQAQVSFRYCFDEAGAKMIRDRIAQAESAAQEARAIDDQLNFGQTPDVPSLFRLRGNAASAYSGLLDAALQSIGDLSQIDGALILDEHLSVLGFGAKLQAIPTAFFATEIDALSGAIREGVPDTDLWGTRHQSAARFVFHNREALCFVASQDGQLTLFGWVINPGVVAAIRGLEHFIWEYERGAG